MIELITPIKVLHSKNCWDARPLGARRGITLHFDDSSTDVSAVEWFTDPECHVSYNRLYLDNGDVVQITPTMEHAAWHNGLCTVNNANRVYYGLAAATNTKVAATERQFEAIAHDCAALFLLNRWKSVDVVKRVIGHEDIACWPNGKLGRKIDPTGLSPKHPILSTARVRARVQELLSI